MRNVAITILVGALAAGALWWLLAQRWESPAVPSPAVESPAVESPAAPLQGRAGTQAHDEDARAAPVPSRAAAAVDVTEASVGSEAAAADAEKLPISGRVVDDAGLPVGGARVFLASIPSSQKTTSSDDDGAFVLSGLDKGICSLAAHHAGLGLACTPQPCTAGSTDVVLRLVETCRVAGRVIDGAGAPVAGALVRVASGGLLNFAPSPEGAYETHIGDVESDARGEFQAFINPDSNGHVLASAAAEGYMPAEVQGFQLRLGEAKVDLELVLALAQSIHGRVVTEDGRGVAQAVVSAREVGDRPGAGPAQTAHSDESGAFTLANLRAGVAYEVAATGAGLVSREALTVTAGGEGVTIVMIGAASISGRVLDEAGEPVAGCHIEYGLPGTAEIFMRERSVTSGEGGAYAIDSLMAGEHLLTYARERHFGSQEISVTLAAGERRTGVDLVLAKPGQITGTVSSDEGKPLGGVQIGFSSNRRVRSVQSGADGCFVLDGVLGRGQMRASAPTGFLQLQPASGDIDGGPGDAVHFVFGRGGILHGRVVDSRGATVPGAKLHLVDAGENPAGDASTGEDGAFELAGLRGGLAQLSVRADGFAELLRRGLELPQRGTVELGDLVLTAGSVLRGRVIDASGAPVASAQVGATTMDASRDYTDRDAKVSVLTDAGGGFELANLANGSHLVVASIAGLAPAWQEVEVPAGGEIVLRLAVGGAIEGTVSGRAPVPGAEVTLDRRASNQLEQALGDERVETRSDAEGRFRFDGLAPGSYSVSAQLPDTGYGKTGQIYQTTLSAKVDVEAGRTTSCDLRLGGCTVQGRIHGYHPTGRAPSAYLFGTGLHKSTPVDDEGGFKIEEVPPGTYTLSIASLGTRQVHVPDAEMFRIEIEAAGGWIEGSVVDAQGAAVGEVSIEATPVSGRPDANRAGRSDASGRYRIDHVEPGTYLVLGVKPPQGSTNNLEVEVPEAGAARADLRFAAGNSKLVVRVRDGGNRPVLQPELQCVGQSGAALASWELAPAARGGGEFEISLAAGTYRVGAGARGLGTAWVDGVELSPEQAAEVTVVLGGPRGRFELRLRHAGAPVASPFALENGSGQPVTELDQTRQNRQMRTSSSGSYESQLLPAGAYRIRVQPDQGELVTREFEVPGDGGVVVIEIDE